MSKADFIISSLCVIALSFLMGLEVGRFYRQKPPTIAPKEKADTLYLRDTITLDKPVFVTKTKLDSVLVPVTDSVTIHDTLFVALERERVVWEDSLSVVYASGIRPQVDSVKHFTTSKVITITRDIPVKVRSKWGIGIQAGYGATDAGLYPYIGVGLSYNILSW